MSNYKDVLFAKSALSALASDEPEFADDEEREAIFWGIREVTHAVCGIIAVLECSPEEALAHVWVDGESKEWSRSIPEWAEKILERREDAVDTG